jgi:hypothetical protein
MDPTVAAWIAVGVSMLTLAGTLAAQFSEGVVGFREAEFSGGIVDFVQPFDWSVPPISPGQTRHPQA